MRDITKQQQSNEYQDGSQGLLFRVQWEPCCEPLSSLTFTIKDYSYFQFPPSAKTTRLCWGLYDSNYIICPICYCFIQARIICFGFLCNVWGFDDAPWEACCTLCALDSLFIKCPVFCQVDSPTMIHRWNIQLHFTYPLWGNNPRTTAEACLLVLLIGPECYWWEKQSSSYYLASTVWWPLHLSHSTHKSNHLPWWLNSYQHDQH